MTLAGVAQVVILTAGTLTALGVLCRLRPVRWLGRTVIGDPILRAFRREVTEVVRAEVPAIVDERLARHPLLNGWGVDAMQKLADKAGADVMPPPEHPPEDPGPS